MGLNSLEQWNVMGAVIERRLTSGRALSEESSWWYPNRKIAIYIFGRRRFGCRSGKPDWSSAKHTIKQNGSYCGHLFLPRKSASPLCPTHPMVCSTCADALASTWSIYSEAILYSFWAQTVSILQRKILLWPPTHK